MVPTVSVVSVHHHGDLLPPDAQIGGEIPQDSTRDAQDKPETRPRTIPPGLTGQAGSWLTWAGWLAGLHG